MRKRYVVKEGCNLVTTIFANEKEYSIEFRGGATYPTYTKGSFVTDDHVLQKAIESDRGFNVSFEAEDTYPVKTQQQIVLCEVDDVLDRQMAIEWIYNHFDVRLPIRSRKSEIVDFARGKGILFTKLN
ncbi:MAG: hypothetical protein RRZ64_05385 [Rikenellaceae bacterium]